MAVGIDRLFSLEGRVAVVTGGSGSLGSAIARGLATAGARVGILARTAQKIDAVAEEIRSDGGDVLGLPADVLRRDDLVRARGTLLDRWGRIDALVNAAGGNVPAATLDDKENFFDLPVDAFREVVDLNLLGTLLPTQVFGRGMGEGPQSQGSIVNISSMAANRAITRVVGYSAAKAAVENFTRWLAVELARKHGAGLRVNAIAPGFFLADQNRRLLLTDDGELTDRGRTILENTPAGRFGEAGELQGTAIWLCSPASTFVTGTVIPVDGGFGAFSGV